jgi:hypothetical protein
MSKRDGSRNIREQSDRPPLSGDMAAGEETPLTRQINARARAAGQLRAGRRDLPRGLFAMFHGAVQDESICPIGFPFAASANNKRHRLVTVA